MSPCGGKGRELLRSAMTFETISARAHVAILTCSNTNEMVQDEEQANSPSRSRSGNGSASEKPWLKAK
jgi:hypothetical protein